MIPLPEIQKIPKVLILGNGLSAFETARQLIALGYEILFINPEDRCRQEVPFPASNSRTTDYLKDQREALEKDPRFTLYTQTALSAIEGFAGEFQTHRISDHKEWTDRVGAIVLAPELNSRGRFEDYDLKPSEQIMALEQLTAVFFSSSQTSSPSGCNAQAEGSGEEGRLAALNSDSYIAFLAGLDSEGNVANMARTLSLALEIRKKYQSQVCVFCQNVKVAEEGLERLYQTCRDEGVLFFKFDQKGPEINRSGDLVTLYFTDSVLGQPFELTPDLLVIDSVHSLPEDVQALAISSQIGLDEGGFLQTANVHLLPQGSQRAGIFITGSGKGPMLPRTCIEEARATALGVHQFFKGGTSEHLQREVTVDKGLCTICLTCLRFCPHQAIGWTHRIFIHPLACQRCGICASECPMDAIQIAGYSDQEVEVKLTAMLTRWQGIESSQSKVVIFGCQRSAGVAWEEAQGSGFKVQGDVEFISLPCAGKLDPDYVLKVLAMGADGVLILACPEENCKSIHGNTYARGRIEEVQEYMEEAGFNPARIWFEPLSSNMVWRLKEVVGQFLRKVKEKSEGDGQ
ncbi:MAG: hypothetical protein C0407_00720 [Desulfobacca sp.]|nr:hypothetical protein [Desulfobacca sp.]